MKLQKFTCAAVLSVLALGAVAPTALAVEDPGVDFIEGKGTIQYRENDNPENDGKEVVDPENPDEKIEVEEEDGSNNNDKKGTLRVDFLSNLKFGEQDITTGVGQFNASATNGTNKDGEAVKRGNFIQVTDKRGNSNQGWTLSAEVTKAFTNTAGDVLDGAEITYTLPYVNSSQKAANFPVATSNATLETTGSNKSAVEMAKADAGKGWGAYTIEYGRPALDAAGDVVEEGGSGVIATPATMDTAVSLKVPANSPLDITSAYVAEITWTIAEL